MKVLQTRRPYQWVVKSNQHITGAQLPSNQAIPHKCCKRRVRGIKDIPQFNHRLSYCGLNFCTLLYLHLRFTCTVVSLDPNHYTRFIFTYTQFHLHLGLITLYRGPLHAQDSCYSYFMPHFRLHINGILTHLSLSSSNPSICYTAICTSR